jgi:uncharacterized protein (DUF58 family)
MNYGSGSVTKFVYARTMAACLAYLILHQRDAMALGIFDSSLREYLPRTDNLASIHNLLRVLACFQPTQPSGISGVLHEMARKVTRRGIFILISDFFDDLNAVLEGIQHLRFSGSEVIVFQVLDPYEIEFPFTGSVEFIGLEGIPKLRTRPAELRQSYLREFQAFVDKLREGCNRAGCNYIQVNTAHPWAEVLSAYLATRQHRYG